MTIPSNIGAVLFMLTVSAVSIAMMLKHRNTVSKATFFWAVSSGAFCFTVSAIFIAAPHMSLSKTLLVLALFVLMPVFPFNGLYNGLLSALPVRLSSLMALLLPAIALTALFETEARSIIGIMMHNSEDAAAVLKTLASIGVVYGALRALTQIRVAPLLGYASLSIYSLIWLYIFHAELYNLKVDIASSRVPLKTLTYHGETMLLLILSTSIAVAAILYSWSLIVKRYDDVEISKVIGSMGGLINTMPRLTLAFTLLIVALMGLPPFGLFSGLTGALFSPSSLGTCLPVMTIIMLIFASWYFVKLTQRVFYGEKKDYKITTGYSADINIMEGLPLFIALALLLILGLVPELILKNIL